MRFLYANLQRNSDKGWFLREKVAVEDLDFLIVIVANKPVGTFALPSVIHEGLVFVLCLEEAAF